MKAIKVVHKGRSARMPARYIASDLDGNRVTVSAENATARDAAVLLCQRMNWKPDLAQGSLKGCEVFVFLS